MWDQELSSVAAASLRVPAVMPWRSKTLTKYVVGGSDDASVDSDNGWQRVGVDLDVESPGNPVGAAASDEVVLWAWFRRLALQQ